jgi:predicted kinase
VIVTGPPASGKTVLSRRIAQRFGLPLVTKDGIKELLFDYLGWGKREWSRRLGRASMEVLFHMVENELRAGRSLVAEANFYPQYHTQRFVDLQTQYPFHPVQILCQTDPDVLLRRYQTRALSGERHPGHLDHILAQAFDFDELRARHGVMAVGGSVQRLDTSVFEAIDYDHLFRFLEGVMGAAGE